MSTSDAKLPMMMYLSYLHNGRQQFLRIISYIKGRANNICSTAPIMATLHAVKTLNQNHLNAEW